MPNIITPWQISVLKALQHFSINKSLQGSYADVSTMGRYCPALRRPLVAFRLTEALGRERSVALSHKTSRGRYSPERNVALGFVVTVEWESVTVMMIDAEHAAPTQSIHQQCKKCINGPAVPSFWTWFVYFFSFWCLFFFFFLKFCFSGYQLTEISLSPHVNKHWCEASKCKALKEQTKQRLTLLVTHFVVFLCFEISFSCAVRDDFCVACQAKCHIFIVY